MTFVTNPYDALYTNLKNKLTIVNDNKEYTVGEYMLMKAGEKQRESSSMALTTRTHEQTAIVSVINFVNDKLTVKNPPKKDRTIRNFPLRTSFSALLSAVAACALVISCGIYALIGRNDAVMPTASENANHLEVELHNYDSDYNFDLD